jgi:hypothetical protein
VELKDLKQSFINLKYTLRASTSRILLGIGITLSIASVVSIYLTSVVTGNQSSPSGQQLSSPPSPSTEGFSQPIASNIESAHTNTGTTTTTTTTNSSAPTTTTEESGDLTQTISSLTPPSNRTVYLENTEISTINQTKLDIPPDVFSLTQITAKKGDTVIINFYDLEDLGGDNHSFTLIDGSYNIDKVLATKWNYNI